MNDYVIPSKRKSKGDKRAKARYQRYRRGGGKIARSKKQNKSSQ